MHSSRMRTGRSLTVCCCSSRGGVLLGPGGGGGLPGRGGGGGFSLVQEGVVCLVRGGFSLVPGGFSLVPGGGVLWRPPSPPVNRITDTCKNITLVTTSLRPVKMSQKVKSKIIDKSIQLRKHF